MSFPVQTLVVQKAGKKKTPGPLDAPVRLINPDGSAFTGTVEVDDGAITTAKLADKAVTAAKIADKTITKAQIADGVIPTMPAAPSTATTSKAGLVRQATAVTNPAADTNDHDQLIALLAALRTAGILAES